jgi:hypothetical protein
MSKYLVAAVSLGIAVGIPGVCDCPKLAAADSSRIMLADSDNGTDAQTSEEQEAQRELQEQQQQQGGGGGGEYASA